MWAIISNHSELKFFTGSSGSAMAIEGVNYAQLRTDGTHEQLVSKLLGAGIILFIKKSDARTKAIEWDLKGYKYIELNPSYIAVTADKAVFSAYPLP